MSCGNNENDKDENTLTEDEQSLPSDESHDLANKKVLFSSYAENFEYTHIILAPNLTKAFAVLTNVYDGIITSSPSFISINIAIISNA
jgi:hypothetical protein